MSRLRHPNILLCMGAVDARQPMIIMEYCERGSLRRHLAAVHESPTLMRSVAVWRLHLRLAAEAAAGLNHAHVLQTREFSPRLQLQFHSCDR